MAEVDHLAENFEAAVKANVELGTALTDAYVICREEADNLDRARVICQAYGLDHVTEVLRATAARLRGLSAMR